MPSRLTRTRRALALVFIIIVIAARPSTGGGLSSEETRLVELAARETGPAEVLIERVVNIPSGTLNVPGVREVGKVFAAEFEKIGFTTRWDEMPASMKRAGHLIAERKGNRGKRLLLIGHLDTVLEGHKFERVGRKAIGNGTVDMKGGDVIVLCALKALHAAGRLEGRSIAVIFTGDEEDAGSPISASRASLLELARKSDAALAFEALADNTAIVARRGVSSWTVKVTSPSGHSSGIHSTKAGSGAIFEAARILEGFRTTMAGEKNLTFNASLILGGTTVSHEAETSQGSAEGKTNVIPGEVMVEGDLRFLSEEQRAGAETRMQAIVEKRLPVTRSEIVFHGEYPAMAPTPGNYALLGVLDRASQDLGLGAVTPFDPGRRGAGDISFIAPLVDSLDGLGVNGLHSHNPREWLDLDSIPTQIKRTALLIDRLR